MIVVPTRSIEPGDTAPFLSASIDVIGGNALLYIPICYKKEVS